MIDTLRLFIDLIDVLGLDDDPWRYGFLILDVVCACHRQDTRQGTMGDVVIWTLEVLGPDFWKSLDGVSLYSLMFCCLESQERMQRLLKLFKKFNNVINARHTVDGYSWLHYKIVKEDPISLLTMGASLNLVGFDPEHSPHRETPISLSMYRANTFVSLQRALKVTKVNLGTTIDQALEQCPLQNSHWTKEALVELFSEDLERSPVVYPQRRVCPYCLYSRLFMAQPYWMRILESIMSRNRSQSIQDIVGTMLSTSSQAAEVNRDEYEGTGPEIDDAHLSDCDDESVSMQSDKEDSVQSDDEVSVESDDEVTRRFRIHDVDDEDMCLFCLQKWRETDLKPSLDESKCSGCDRSLSSAKCMGRSDYNRLYCVYCAKAKQQQRRHPTPKVDSEDEEDHYSPYLIHT